MRHRLMGVMLAAAIVAEEGDSAGTEEEGVDEISKIPRT